MNNDFKVRQIVSKHEFNEVFEEISLMLVKAFYNDPYYVYIMPNEKKRAMQLQWWLKILLKYSFIYGRIYITSNKKGAALWIGPLNPTLRNLQLAALGLIAYPFKVGPINFWRMLTVSFEWEALHKKELNMHYYLLLIGVEPSVQRKGIGSLLMANELKKADDEGHFCYLETMTEDDVLFYQKNQFEVIRRSSIKNGNPYWIMKRYPLSMTVKRSVLADFSTT